ncbi:transketolase [Candidatus Wolfebacteria bacterium CG10_big_fil_rev_8_21_14_0_10_31_9]|uniref:Transketolase n=1 Tax=Candidatus Wolfebacteria bacterium CG10_big_fil_rev_8_21_14_0_10_31_9 TaxID=1975070 RepID=A0A2H0RCU5_9BACT|nr:MAG: transketolase [Candidatus Wolfebacteria bacterium CG10_big_fil_rev_8_21_14_0_10_31_9]
MLTKEIFDKIFSEHPQEKPLRDGFGEGLLLAGKLDKDVVVLCADLKESTRCHWFAEKYPDRFFEIGVAEQNMASIAAGLGISNKIPFISSYATFSPGRNWEQIRTTIAYNDSNVKIAGHHAGISTGPDGATHQAIEDIATMRAIPNMKVIVPCDAIEAKKAVLSALHIWGPMYFRLTREKTPIITNEETPFIPQKAYTMWESKKPQVVIIGAGPILYEALLSSKELEKEKIGTIVLNSHTIKPLDENKIIELAKKCGAVVSVEEHNIIGGLGSAISEVLVKNYPAPMEFVGIKDVFGESGTPDELAKKYNLKAKDIIKAVKKVIKRK